jgi:hypothetical protein|tara:strand:- start:425 stop:697 length:273 start_codon:yes stop_codon:yes gene_type:complete
MENKYKYNSYGEIEDDRQYKNLILEYFLNPEINKSHHFCDCNLIVHKNFLYFHKYSSPNHNINRRQHKRKTKYHTNNITKDNLKICVSFE